MHCKSYSHFFSKKFQHICISLDVNFNESLANDIVSFEQLGPAEFANCMLSVNQVFSVCNSCIYFAFSLELDFVCLYFDYHFKGKLSR